MEIIKQNSYSKHFYSLFLLDLFHYLFVVLLNEEIHKLLLLLSKIFNVLKFTTLCNAFLQKIQYQVWMLENGLFGWQNFQLLMTTFKKVHESICTTSSICNMEGIVKTNRMKMWIANLVKRQIQLIRTHHFCWRRVCLNYPHVWVRRCTILPCNFALQIKNHRYKEKFTFCFGRWYDFWMHFAFLLHHILNTDNSISFCTCRVVFNKRIFVTGVNFQTFLEFFTNQCMHQKKKNQITDNFRAVFHFKIQNGAELRQVHFAFFFPWRALGTFVFHQKHFLWIQINNK